MPVPMMLAITMEDAVKKPIVRRGVRDFTERCSVTVTISESTIPKFSGLANSFEVLFKFMIGEKVLCHSERSEESLVYLVFSWLVCALEQNSEMFRFAQHDTRHFPRLSEAIPGITLKAA